MSNEMQEQLSLAGSVPTNSASKENMVEFIETVRQVGEDSKTAGANDEFDDYGYAEGVLKALDIYDARALRECAPSPEVEVIAETDAKEKTPADIFADSVKSILGSVAEDGMAVALLAIHDAHAEYVKQNQA